MSSMQALETSGTGLDLESWLRPISEKNPAGANLRYEPLYAEIRYAREEDDPNLPMGQWERPLKVPTGWLLSAGVPRRYKPQVKTSNSSRGLLKLG